MKQLKIDDILKLTKNSKQIYKHLITINIKSLEDFKNNLILVKGKNKKQKLEKCLSDFNWFIIAPNKSSFDNLDILDGFCADDSSIKDFRVGSNYHLKCGDPFVIKKGKCLGEVKIRNLEDKSYIVFREKDNFYFVPVELGDIDFLEIIK